MPTKVNQVQDPLVEILFAEMKKLKMSAVKLEMLSGVPKATPQQWRYRSKPTVEAMRLCLKAVGLDLVVVRHTKEKKKK